MKLELPYVPSPEKRLKVMMEFADPCTGLKAVDLGAGDGRVVIALAKKGAEAVGYEIDGDRAYLGERNIEKEGMEDSARIFNQDFWGINLRHFDVVTVYGITGIMERLEAKLQKELKAGARVISNSFPFPHWKPEKIEEDVYLYIR